MAAENLIEILTSERDAAREELRKLKLSIQLGEVPVLERAEREKLHAGERERWLADRVQQTNTIRELRAHLDNQMATIKKLQDAADSKREELESWKQTVDKLREELRVWQQGAKRNIAAVDEKWKTEVEKMQSEMGGEIVRLKKKVNDLLDNIEEDWPEIDKLNAFTREVF